MCAQGKLLGTPVTLDSRVLLPWGLLLAAVAAAVAGKLYFNCGGWLALAVAESARRDLPKVRHPPSNTR